MDECLTDTISLGKIRIALIGSISVGKSTLLNALFVKQFSKTKIKRTTMLPYVFRETKTKMSKKDLKKINDEINEKNEKFVKETENSSLPIEKCIPVYYNVPTIFDLIGISNRENVELEIYDIPGLDDSRTKDVYFKWVTQNFYLFDIIIFITTIETALNNAGEVDILNLILSNIDKHQNEYNRNIDLIVLVNKCDNMIYEDDKLTFNDSDKEYQEMFDNIKTTINTEIGERKINYEIFPISIEETFIYRTVYVSNEDEIDLDDKYIHKMGINEFGKTRWNKHVKTDFEYYKKKLLDKLKTKEIYLNNMKQSGYFAFRNYFNKLLGDNTKKYFIGRLNYINSIKILTSDDIDYFIKMERYLKSENKINQLFGCDTNVVTNYIIDDIKKYIIKLDVEKVESHDDFIEKKNKLKSLLHYVAYLLKYKLYENIKILLEEKIIGLLVNYISTYMFIFNYYDISIMNDKLSIFDLNLNERYELGLEKKIFFCDLQKNINLENHLLVFFKEWINITNHKKYLINLDHVNNMFGGILTQINKYKLLTDHKIIKKFILKIIFFKIGKMEGSDKLIYILSAEKYIEDEIHNIRQNLDIYLFNTILLKIKSDLLNNFNEIIDTWFDIKKSSIDVDLTLEKCYISYCQC